MPSCARQLGGVLEIQVVAESLLDFCRSGEAFGLSSCVTWAGLSIMIVSVRFGRGHFYGIISFGRFCYSSLQRFRSKREDGIPRVRAF